MSSTLRQATIGRRSGHRLRGIPYERQAQLNELERVNGELAAEVDRLETEDGIREAAREEIGFVEAGEERFTILPLPPLPRNLPDGWPYNVVTGIIAARTAGPAPVVAD